MALYVPVDNLNPTPPILMPFTGALMRRDNMMSRLRVSNLNMVS